jgi:glycosyltransferase involved in cell wall biosynthesis
VHKIIYSFATRRRRPGDRRILCSPNFANPGPDARPEDKFKPFKFPYQVSAICDCASRADGRWAGKIKQAADTEVKALFNSLQHRLGDITHKFFVPALRRVLRPFLEFFHRLFSHKPANTAVKNEKNLRILQVNSYDICGGAEKISLSLHRLYPELGCHSIMVVGHKFSDDPGILAFDGFARRKGLGMAKMLAERHLGWQYLYHPGSHKLPKLVKEPWDIAHLHNLHGGYFDLAALPRLSRLAPVVLHLHDNWLQTGHCACHLACERWRTGCGSCPDLAIYPGISRDGTRFNWRRKRRLIQQSRLWITAPSQWLLDEARDSLLAGKPMRLVRNGIDLETFAPRPREQARTELGLPQGIPLIVSCGLNILTNPFKDGKTLLLALRQVLKILPEARLVALGVSETPPGFEDLAGAVIVRPFEKDQRKVAAYYNAGDVYAQASRVESFSLTVCEAMASGLPVAATAVGGLPELVEHERTGLLVPPQDPAALAATLLRMLQNRAFAAAQTQNALQVARQHYDIRAQARNYLDWYAEIIREFRATKVH